MSENFDISETSDETPTINQEQKKQVESTINFARFLTARFPQIDDMRTMAIDLDKGNVIQTPTLPDAIKTEPQLNYYLTGSMATVLLSKADQIEVCQETEGADIKTIRTVINPETTRTALAEFARPIGDIDYVPTKHYELLQAQAQNSHGNVSETEYQQNKAKYLGKGGGGLKFDEIPPDAIDALKRNPGDVFVTSDPVETFGTKKFAKINIEGQDYFVARPDTIIGYKFLHMLQAFNQKPEKINADFTKLHQAMIGLYTEEELVKITYDIIDDYDQSIAEVYTTFGNTPEPESPKMIQELLSKPNLGEEAKSFAGKVIEFDKSHKQIFI